MYGNLKNEHGSVKIGLGPRFFEWSHPSLPQSTKHQHIESHMTAKNVHCPPWTKRIVSGVTSRRFERLTFRKLQVILESDALPLRHEA